MSYRNQNIRCLCLACIFSFSMVYSLRGNPDFEAYKIYLAKCGFNPEVCANICEIGKSRENYRTWTECFKCINLLKGPSEEKISAILCLCTIGAKQTENNPRFCAGINAIIGNCFKEIEKTEFYRRKGPSEQDLFSQVIRGKITLADILRWVSVPTIFSEYLRLPSCPVQTISGPGFRRLNNPILVYLNNFGFSPKVCLQIINLRSSENYVTWRKCLKRTELLGDTEQKRVTAKLCLLLIGARQINRVPERAAGLRSIIGEELQPFRNGSLTRIQKKLNFLIWREIFDISKRPWKVRVHSGKFDRSHNPGFGRIHSSFDLKSDSKTESDFHRKIPRSYPGTL